MTSLKDQSILHVLRIKVEAYKDLGLDYPKVVNDQKEYEGGKNYKKGLSNLPDQTANC